MAKIEIKIRVTIPYDSETKYNPREWTNDTTLEIAAGGSFIPDGECLIMIGDEDFLVNMNELATIIRSLEVLCQS